MGFTCAKYGSLKYSVSLNCDRTWYTHAVDCQFYRVFKIWCKSPFISLLILFVFQKSFIVNRHWCSFGFDCLLTHQHILFHCYVTRRSNCLARRSSGKGWPLYFSPTEWVNESVSKRVSEFTSHWVTDWLTTDSFTRSLTHTHSLNHSLAHS